VWLFDVCEKFSTTLGKKAHSYKDYLKDSPADIFACEIPDPMPDKTDLGARPFLYTFMVETSEKNVPCPRCSRAMTYQGNESVGPGASRIRNVPVYLCPMCGCKGWYDEKLQKVTEIQ
jgi:hypothetical protein